MIAKWLTAGVLEQGRLIVTEEGTPQGAVISPLLANIYLHYVYDLVHQWRQRCARATVVVRYADDTIVGFEHRREDKGGGVPCRSGPRLATLRALPSPRQDRDS